MIPPWPRTKAFIASNKPTIFYPTLDAENFSRFDITSFLQWAEYMLLIERTKPEIDYKPVHLLGRRNFNSNYNFIYTKSILIMSRRKWGFLQDYAAQM
jgi:hypothetical protein